MEIETLFSYFAIAFLLFVVILVSSVELRKKLRMGYKTQFSSKSKQFMNRIAIRNNLQYLEFTDKRFFLNKNLRQIEELGHDLSCQDNIFGYAKIKDKDAEIAWGTLNFKQTTERSHRFGRGFNETRIKYKETENYSTYYYYISHSDLRIPYFFMRDEHALIDSVGKVLGGQDINFTPNDAFSSSFVLQGEMEEEIRRIFTPEIRKLFTNLAGKKYYFEGEYDFIVVRGPIIDEKDFVQLNKTMQNIVSKLIEESNQTTK